MTTTTTTTTGRPDGRTRVTVADLTDRQRQILALAATGITHDAIARHLGISPHTVSGALLTITRRVGCSGIIATLWHLGLIAPVPRTPAPPAPPEPRPRPPLPRRGQPTTGRTVTPAKRWAELPEHERAVLRRYAAGYTTAQTAAELGVTESAVRERVHTTARRLGVVGRMGVLARLGMIRLPAGDR